MLRVLPRQSQYSVSINSVSTVHSRHVWREESLALTRVSSSKARTCRTEAPTARVSSTVSE